MQDIIILGGGFAGLWAALSARRASEDNKHNLSITLVSNDDHFTLKPRLYQHNPDSYRLPLRPILDPMDIAFVKSTVTEINTNDNQINLTGPTKALSYRRLIIALGSVLNPLPIPGADTAFNLDSWGAARAFEDHLIQVMPKIPTPTIAIIGSGFAGIEIAMEMRSRIEPASNVETARAARILLLDSTNVVGSELGVNPRPVIQSALDSEGVETSLGSRVQSIDRGTINLSTGEQIAASTIIATTGVRANPLMETLNVATDSSGRVTVDLDLRISGHANIFAAGDVARALVDDAGNLALMSCQHAMPMGRFCGHNAACDVMRLPTSPYRQERYVTCLDLGKAGAMFCEGWEREVLKTGADAKKIKQHINETLIYPPTGTRAQIMEASGLLS